MLVRIPITSEDHTWSLTLVGVPISGEYIKDQNAPKLWSRIFITGIPTNPRLIWEGGLRGRIMLHSRLEPLTTHPIHSVVLDKPD